jgi:hypothetical protein
MRTYAFLLHPESFDKPVLLDGCVTTVILILITINHIEVSQGDTCRLSDLFKVAQFLNKKPFVQITLRVVNARVTSVFVTYSPKLWPKSCMC